MTTEKAALVEKVKHLIATEEDFGDSGKVGIFLSISQWRTILAALTETAYTIDADENIMIGSASIGLSWDGVFKLQDANKSTGIAPDEFEKVCAVHAAEVNTPAPIDEIQAHWMAAAVKQLRLWVAEKDSQTKTGLLASASLATANALEVMLSDKQAPMMDAEVIDKFKLKLRNAIVDVKCGTTNSGISHYTEVIINTAASIYKDSTLSRPASGMEFVPHIKHKKRGTFYQVIGEVTLQTERPREDNERLMLYKGEDGKYWARPHQEFDDGRFEAIAKIEKGRG